MGTALGATLKLEQVWQAVWAPAMDAVLYIRPLEPGGDDCCASSPEAASNGDWYGRAYGWYRGAVLAGVRADEHGHLCLAVHAVDRHGRPDLRLGEIGDGWVRDAEGWLAFATGIQLDVGSAELDPLRAAATNMAAQIMWLSGRRQRRRTLGPYRFSRFSRLAGAWMGSARDGPSCFAAVTTSNLKRCNGSQIRAAYKSKRSSPARLPLPSRPAP